MAAGGTTATTDVEVTIARFLADASCASLELPNLTAEQRKCARKLADQHPELKCESYGFGAERQLHLFKKAPAGEATPSSEVRVKNTFIDDWIAPEGDAAEPVVFRSMPQSIPRDLLQPPAENENGKVETASPSCSTTSAAASSPSPGNGEILSPTSPASGSRDPHTLPEGVEVRNTFIHIESAPADERVVQSMPHGMFRQCLLAEAGGGNQVAAAATAVVAASAVEVPPVQQQQQPAPPLAPPMVVPPPVAQPMIALGSEVMVEGLTKYPAFNGLVGFVQALDETIGRYDVLLFSPAAPGGRQWAKIKGENLRLMMPSPPPCFAPTVASR